MSADKTVSLLRTQYDELMEEARLGRELIDECEKVGTYASAAVLVKHHRANMALASALDIHSMRLILNKVESGDAVVRMGQLTHARALLDGAERRLHELETK